MWSKKCSFSKSDYFREVKMSQSAAEESMEEEGIVVDMEEGELSDDGMTEDVVSKTSNRTPIKMDLPDLLKEYRIVYLPLIPFSKSRLSHPQEH